MCQCRLNKQGVIELHISTCVSQLQERISYIWLNQSIYGTLQSQVCVCTPFTEISLNSPHYDNNNMFHICIPWIKMACVVWGLWGPHCIRSFWDNSQREVHKHCTGGVLLLIRQCLQFAWSKALIYWVHEPAHGQGRLEVATHSKVTLSPNSETPTSKCTQSPQVAATAVRTLGGKMCPNRIPLPLYYRHSRRW